MHEFGSLDCRLYSTFKLENGHVSLGPSKCQSTIVTFHRQTGSYNMIPLLDCFRSRHREQEQQQLQGISGGAKRMSDETKLSETTHQLQ